MGTRTFELPDLGEGIAEGELVSWTVAAGDTVEQDEVIAEVETDKALVEVPSPYDGTVTELHFEEGEIVPVDAVIATFEVDGEGDEAAAEPDAAGDVAGAPGSTAPTPAPESATEAGDPETSAAGDAGETGGDVETPAGRVFASPSTRSLARELGVDLTEVQGSDPGGRVTGADVRAHLRNGSTAGGEGPTTETTTAEASGAAASATPEPSAERTREGTDAGSEAISAEGAADVPRTGTSGADTGTVASADTPAAEPRNRTLAMPATRALATDLGVDLDAVPTSEQRDGEAFATPEDVRSYAERLEAGASGTAATATDSSGGTGPTGTESRGAGAAQSTAAAGEPGERPGDRVPYRGVRRTIGERMAQSKYTAPHVSHHDEFDASRLVEVREELAEAADAEGVNLTYLPFVITAITRALTEFPYLNSSLDEAAEEIVLHDEYNIGIAVSTDAGLMVPVVENADQKGLKTLAEEVDDLATRARNRTISPEEMRGGTFTVTNIGVIGGQFSSPIINHPEAAIFAMGPIEERPWVVDGEVVARPTMRISMSVDHRLVDGADAARFANRVQELLGEPSRLLL